MSYIGRQPTVGNFQICDAISVVNGQAAYTMQVGSVNVVPQSANHMIVSLNGTIQKPNSSFTVSGSTITFASNLATGDVIDFIQILGDVLDLGVPSDATVTSVKIVDDSVTLAKMASGTDGNIISYDASGNPVAVATGSAGQVLTSAGAGAPPTFAAAASPDVVLLASSGNLTSGSRYNADNVFSSTYKSYKIIGTNLRFSADAPIAFIFRTGGGSGSDSGQSRYNYVHHRVERNSGGVDNAITLTAWQGGVGKITQDTESDDINKTAGFEFQVFDPNATKSTNFINHSVAWDATGAWIVNMIGGGTYNYEAALTGIGIYPTSGNYVNGEIKIYGFK